MMDWNKPRNAWQWLLFVAPAAAAMLAAQMARWWMPPIPLLHLGNGMVIANTARIAVRYAGISLAVIVVSSVILALVVSRVQGLRERIAQVMLVTLGLFVVNSFIAFYGCALLRVGGPREFEIPPEPVDPSVEKSSAQP